MTTAPATQGSRLALGSSTPAGPAAVIEKVGTWMRVQSAVRGALTQSVSTALLTMWELVDHSADEAGRITPLRSGSAFVEQATTMLNGLQRVHGIEWLLPVDELARLTAATLNGLVIVQRITGDTVDCREAIGVFAHDLAGHGRLAQGDPTHN